MKPECYLHLGVYKTGTTSLQVFFNLNRNTFSDLGVYYPKSPGLNRHHKISVGFTHYKKWTKAKHIFGIQSEDDRLNFLERFKEDFKQEMSNLPPNIGRVILSDEACCNFSLQECRDLFGFLSQLFSNIVGIIYIRRQDEISISNYSQSIKTGDIPISIFPSQELIPSYYWYDTVLDKWESYLGSENIQVRVFKRNLFKNRSIIHDFMERFGGFDISNLVIPKDKNRSISSFAETYLLGMNCYLKENDIKLKNSDRQWLRAFLEEKYSGKGSIPTRSNAKEFVNIFRQSNESVRLKYFKTLPTLFSDDFTIYPESIDDSPLSKHSEILGISYDVLASCIKKYSHLRLQNQILEARLAISEEDYNMAEGILKKLRVQNPNNGQIYFLLSNIYYRQGNKDKAIMCAKKAFEIHPGNEDYKKHVEYLTNLLQ